MHASSIGDLKKEIIKKKKLATTLAKNAFPQLTFMYSRSVLIEKDIILTNVFTFWNLLYRMVMHWLKSRKLEEKRDRPQYEQDYDLSPQGDHSMFWEYLEVGKHKLRYSVKNSSFLVYIVVESKGEKRKPRITNITCLKCLHSSIKRKSEGKAQIVEHSEARAQGQYVKYNQGTRKLKPVKKIKLAFICLNLRAEKVITVA